MLIGSIKKNEEKKIGSDDFMEAIYFGTKMKIKNTQEKIFREYNKEY